MPGDDRQPGGDRHASWWRRSSRAVGGQDVGQRGGGGAAVEDHAAVGAGQQVERRGGDLALALGAGAVPLAEPGLDEREGAGRDGAAVHPAQHARPARAAARSRRTVSVVTPNCSATAVTATRPRSATSVAMACWRSSAYTGPPPRRQTPLRCPIVWVSCCDCVVLRPIR